MTTHPSEANEALGIAALRCEKLIEDAEQRGDRLGADAWLVALRSIEAAEKAMRDARERQKWGRRCNAWSYPGHQSWDAQLNEPDGRRCALDADHQGNHELTGPWTQRDQAPSPRCATCGQPKHPHEYRHLFVEWRPGMPEPRSR